MSSRFLPFQEARAIVRAIGFKKALEYQQWLSTDRPHNIPSNPDLTYGQSGWVGWSDWLGIPSYRDHFKPFKEARLIARGLKLKNRAAWLKLGKAGRPVGVPFAPDVIYATDGWAGWTDWLDIIIPSNAVCTTSKSYLSFEDARKIVRAAKLGSSDKWWAWSKQNGEALNIPSKPHIIYADLGWVNWVDWIREDRIGQSRFKSFIEARAFMRSLQLRTHASWYKWSCSGDRPWDIPSAPNKYYADSGWVSWSDWLGVDLKSNCGGRIYLHFIEARIYARSLGFHTSKEWKIWANTSSRPLNIPARPNYSYQTYGWSGWADWLGVVE